MESSGSLTLDFDDWHQEPCLTDLMLMVTSPEGKSSRRPVSWARMFIGGAGRAAADIVLADSKVEGKAISLVYRDNCLFLTQLGSVAVEVNGAPQTFAKLEAGDEFSLAGWSFRLLRGCEEPIAFVEGLSEPHRGCLWPVGKEPISMGRRGSRENSVELDDRSVSRAHATLRWKDGLFMLQPESQTSILRLNGRTLEGATAVSNGDTIGIGRQLLRFQTVKSSLDQCTGTVVYASLRCADFWQQEAEVALLKMDELLRCCQQIIEAHGGTVARYLGDAPLAFFTGRKHAVQGLAAAVALDHAVGQLASTWEVAGGDSLSFGFGVATGDMAIGVMGPAGKAELSAVGSAVQLALRLENLGRELGERILVAPSTANAEGQEFSLESTGVTAVFERRDCEVFRLTGPLSATPKVAEKDVLHTLGVGTDDKLRELLTERAFTEGETLFLQGEPSQRLYMLVQGSVALTALSAGGREFTLAIRRAGELVGESALLDGEPRDSTARALAAGRCLVLSTSDWDRFVNRHPALAKGVIKSLCSHLKDSHTRIEDLGVRTVKQRLAAVLARLAEQEGRPEGDAVLLDPAVNYSLLVGLLCTNRESVSRAARELIDKGLLERRGHNFVVPDVHSLREAGDD